jgi:hypothetical protein
MIEESAMRVLEEASGLLGTGVITLVFMFVMSPLIVTAS